MILRLSILTIMITAGMHCFSQQLELAKNGVSAYKLCVPKNASPADTKAATVLQDYFYRVTGVRLSLERETEKPGQSPGIFIGLTTLAAKDKGSGTLTDEGFLIRTVQKDILIYGRGTKSSLYGVYDFIEKYLGCRKWDSGPAVTTKITSLSVPSFISEKEEPAFRYREVYLPPAFDDEYLD